MKTASKLLSNVMQIFAVNHPSVKIRWEYSMSVCVCVCEVS